jgi:DNA-nicking Smr family endonuclease
MSHPAGTLRAIHRRRGYWSPCAVDFNPEGRKVSRKARRRFPTFDTRDDLQDAPVADTIDLHGLSAVEAEHTVLRIVENWHRRGGGVLYFITGKGRGSAAGPVLKRKVAALLKRDLSAYVADHAPDDAGGGFKVRVR